MYTFRSYAERNKYTSTPEFEFICFTSTPEAPPVFTPTSNNPAIIVSPIPAQEEQFYHLDTANSTDFSRGDINASDELFVNLNATVEQQTPSSGN